MQDENLFVFDKFMDDILIKEASKNKRDGTEEDTPQRRYNKLYRELPQNRIKFISGAK